MRANVKKAMAPKFVIAGRAKARRGALSAQREDVPLGCNLAGPGWITGHSRRKRNCLPEIATAPLGPRNDNLWAVSDLAHELHTAVADADGAGLSGREIHRVHRPFFEEAFKLHGKRGVLRSEIQLSAFPHIADMAFPTAGHLQIELFDGKKTVCCIPYSRPWSQRQSR